MKNPLGGLAGGAAALTGPGASPGLSSQMHKRALAENQASAPPINMWHQTMGGGPPAPSQSAPVPPAMGYPPSNDTGGMGHPDGASAAAPTTGPGSPGFGSLAQGFSGTLGNPTWDPSYDWRSQQGQKGIERSAAVHGTLLTGGTLKDLMNYGQGLASTEYGNAWDRSYRQWMGDQGIFDSNRNFQFNSMATLGNMGLNAANSYLGYLGQSSSAGANAQAGAAAGRGASWGNTLSDAGDLASSAWMWGQPTNGGQNYTQNAANDVARRLR